jgi:hypothetical protein
MSKLELTLMKNPTLQDIYRLFERITGRRPVWVILSLSSLDSMALPTILFSPRD